MDWKSHVAAALISFAIVLVSLNAFGSRLGLAEMLIGLVVSVFYGLLPDIDIETSKIHGFVGALLLLGAIAFLAAFAMQGWAIFLPVFVALVIAVLAMNFLRHRGFCHTMRFGLLLSAPLYFASPAFFIFAFAAFLSHLFADLELRL